MQCNPSPEITCGTINYDSCIVYTGVWPSCFPGESCPRQSDFNLSAATLICDLQSKLNCLLTSVTGSTTPDSSCNVKGLSCGTVPISDGTVKENFQAIYNQLCNLTFNIQLPATGLDLGCLAIPCSTTPPTIGQVLQALIVNACDSTGNPKIYRAILTQSGTAAPTVVVLENTVGNIVWTRSSTGIYVGTLYAAFQPGKVFLVLGASINAVTSSFTRTTLNTVTINTTTDGILSETAVEIRVYP